MAQKGDSSEVNIRDKVEMLIMDYEKKIVKTCHLLLKNFGKN